MAKAARRHTTGGGAVVPGLPWAFTHIRGPERNRQVILAVDPITADGPAEGHLVVDQYLQAAAELPGLVGYAYDRALRGVHLDRLLKAGHIGLVGLHRSKGKPADRYHGTEPHHPATGQPVEVEIHLVEGAPHIRTFDVDGNQHLQPLQRRRINRRHNRRDGDFRISAEYDVITDPATGEADGYVRIRLDQTAEDQLTGYNRPEHLRAFPETDPVFADIQRSLRSSAESANRTIDDHLPRERLHHFGFRKEPTLHARLADLPQRPNRSRLRTQPRRPRRHAATARTHRLNRRPSPTDRQATYRRVSNEPGEAHRQSRPPPVTPAPPPNLSLQWRHRVSNRVVNPSRPRGASTTNHCVHGRGAITEQILDWHPFEYFTERMDIPMMGTWTQTYEFLAKGEDATELRIRIQRLRGKQRGLYRLIRNICPRTCARTLSDSPG